MRQVFHSSATCVAPLGKMFPRFRGFFQLYFSQIFCYFSADFLLNKYVFLLSNVCGISEKNFPQIWRIFSTGLFPDFLLLVRRFLLNACFFFYRNMWEICVSSLKKRSFDFADLFNLIFPRFPVTVVPRLRSYKVRFSQLSERVTLAIYNVVIVQTVKNYTVINNAMPEQSILMTLSCFKKNFLV